MPHLPGLIPSAAQKVQQAVSISSSSNQQFIDAAMEGDLPEYIEEGASSLGNEVEQLVSEAAQGIGEIAASSLEFGVQASWDVIKPLLVRYWYVIIPIIALLLYFLYKFIF